jgi:DNA-binding CsgD family transcriptional regulator
MALIACTYSFIRVIFEFKEKTMTQKINLFITAGILIICISYIIGLTIYFIQGSNHWIKSTYRGLFPVSGLIFITGLLSLVITKQTGQNNRKHKSIKAFGWISLIGYFLVYTNSFLPEPLSIFTTSAGLLVLNTGHIIWLRTYFLRHYVSFSGEQDQQFLESIFKQYQISNREQEILQLLMQGKSNKEIESALYISYNTVKNHIYNLYQKLGVNSRWQMLHLVMKSYDQKQNHPK